MPSALAGLGARLYTRIGGANAHAPAFNCVVTNVPGSRIPLYFCGAKMVGMYGMGPVFDSMGLINAVYSYGDTISVSFTCDRDMMPDPQTYAQALRDSYEALKEAVARSAAPQAAPAGANENPPSARQRRLAGAKTKAPATRATARRVAARKRKGG